MADKVFMFFQALFSVMGLRLYVGYFTTNSTSDPLAAETEAPGVTITRNGVGAFTLTYDVTPKAVLFSGAFLKHAAGTASTERAVAYSWDTTDTKIVYQSAAGTAADTDGKVIGFLIVTRDDRGVPT